MHLKEKQAVMNSSEAENSSDEGVSKQTLNTSKKTKKKTHSKKKQKVMNSSDEGVSIETLNTSKKAKKKPRSKEKQEVMNSSEAENSSDEGVSKETLNTSKKTKKKTHSKKKQKVMNSSDEGVSIETLNTSKKAKKKPRSKEKQEVMNSSETENSSDEGASNETLKRKKTKKETQSNEVHTDNDKEEDSTSFKDLVHTDNDNEEDSTSFKDLGVTNILCEACTALKWKAPTKIQKEAIPVALEGKDVIGLAETGSGKTGAFALPILQSLLEHPQRLFALILTPTRELAYQISEQFEALGGGIGVKTAVIVGGMDMMSQSLVLAKKPHIIVATPGRLVDHLVNTKGFNLKPIKYLVMDEADRILNMDFEVDVDKILKVMPRERVTMLFSATMTRKVQKLQRASLQDPVKVEVSSKYATVDKLQQYYLFIPVRYKHVYLVSLLNDMAGNSFMIFCSTCVNTMTTALMLRNLGLAAVPLHGQMTQNKRLAALTKFRAKSRSILISTDVASRGLDIPHVDVVINFDIPTHSKDYIHRVGRTARAGRSGVAVTLVTQYDVELYQRIEFLIGKKLPLYKTEEADVLCMQERVAEARRMASREMKDFNEKKGSKRKKMNFNEDDTENAIGFRRRLSEKKKK